MLLRRVVLSLAACVLAAVVPCCSASDSAAPARVGPYLVDGGADQSAEGGGDAARDGDAAGDAASDADGGGPCVPKNCAQLNAECGSAPDGCGGKVECGTCPAGTLCGGAGVNRCGHNACNPKTCTQVAASCGYASDMCGSAIDCGDCMPPQQCGLGGKLNECGCQPKTCSQLGASCGSLPDGCGGKVDCGSCPSGQACGGGGPNKCGTGPCTPKTCMQLGASCGFASDGCNTAMNCGDCKTPQVCGGGGTANQCGCKPKTCSQLQASCGMVDTGCGAVDCGTCGPDETCGGGGAPSQCGCTCTLPHAITKCSAGQCSVEACQASWGDCDGNAANGCEVGTDTNTSHCGSCGMACAIGHATPKCVGGVCQIGSCETGYADCNNDPKDGCEANLATDPANCSTCGHVCPSGTGTPVCNAGTCGVSNCNQGLGDCDNDNANGCETNLTSTAAHCGACGNACNLFHATPKCEQGTCKISMCDSGAADCDGNASNGCEINTTADVGNCGACGSSCAVPNANVACSNSKCVITQCTGGFGDCNGVQGDGCELYLGDNIANCGTCGYQCSSIHGTPSCVAGSCQIACDQGFANCNASAADGCEIDLNTNASSCGGCYQACSSNHGNVACGGGQCIIACHSGWADCDGNARSNGCETDLNNSVNDCGQCGHVCSNAGGTPSCMGGVCNTNCSPGLADCNGLNGDGCEQNIASDPAHCGSCSNNCNSPQPANSSGNPCSNGSCLLSCNGGAYDTNGVFSDGCECTADGVSDTCGSASSLGTLGIGASNSGSGNITPASDVDYWVVTFTGQDSCSFHPVITLSDPSGQLRIDVTTDCWTTMSCVEGGGSAGVTQYEYLYSTPCGYLTYPVDPWRYPTGTSTFYIKVYRAVGGAASCLQYTITAQG